MRVFHKSKYLFLLVFLTLLIFTTKLFFLHPTFSDENTYINMGKEVLNGKVPYKDFFFAHPPLQLYSLALIFKIFGSSFLAAKIFSLMVSFASVFLLFFITRELFNEKIALISSILLLFWPGFLIFSGQQYGMWEIVLLFLVSVYLVLKDRLALAGAVFSFGLFFRYLLILYLPFLLILLYLKKESMTKFLTYFFVPATMIFLLMFSLFGYSFVDNSILFQITTKIREETLPKLVFQYLDLGYFSLFLALLSAIFAYLKKNKMILLFSLYPIIIDLLILLSLKTVIYHYFLLSLPLVMLVTGNLFFESKEKTVKLLIILVFILSIFHNLPTFDFYMNPKSSESLIQIAQFVQNNTKPADTIFGEPVVANYVSFATGRKISANYLDSYPRHLLYEGEQSVLERIKANPPKAFITTENLYFLVPSIEKYFSENYQLAKGFPGISSYEIYLKK